MLNGNKPLRMHVRVHSHANFVFYNLQLVLLHKLNCFSSIDNTLRVSKTHIFRLSTIIFVAFVSHCCSTYWLYCMLATKELFFPKVTPSLVDYSTTIHYYCVVQHTENDSFLPKGPKSTTSTTGQQLAAAAWLNISSCLLALAAAAAAAAS